MILNVTLPLLVGLFGVLQNTLNRQLAPALGLTWLLLVNGLVVAVCGLLFFLVLRLVPATSLPPLYRLPLGGRPFQALDLLPGFLGFFIIATAPWAIERLGATKTFIGIVGAQIVASIVWDWWVDSVAVSGWRIAGAFLALLGAALTAF